MVRDMETYSILNQYNSVYGPDGSSARTGRWRWTSMSRYPDLKVRRFPPATPKEDQDLTSVVI